MSALVRDQGQGRRARASRAPSRRARLRRPCPHVVTGQTIGAGHFPQLEVREQVNAMIDRFLALAGPEPAGRP